MTSAIEMADSRPGSGNNDTSVTECKPLRPLPPPSHSSPGPRDLSEGRDLALPLELQREAHSSLSPHTEQPHALNNEQTHTASIASLPKPLAADAPQSQTSDVTSVQRQLAACSLEESQREASSSIAKKTPSLPRKVTPCQSWRATGHYELWPCDDPKCYEVFTLESALKRHKKYRHQVGSVSQQSSK